MSPHHLPPTTTGATPTSAAAICPMASASQRTTAISRMLAPMARHPSSPAILERRVHPWHSTSGHWYFGRGRNSSLRTTNPSQCSQLEINHKNINLSAFQCKL
ncbi:hypothetical protein BDA96_03G102200 [Sorghum bicolor]|uniref:Uncharacterized protein n=1 Tax=Sorghum bicolor TaxID=4558 RepID=A0A921ULT6_SORBI|nr:hypothetical protein BDA96_03G102200 [Sorghum bicolor]